MKRGRKKKLAISLMDYMGKTKRHETAVKERRDS